MKSQFLVLLLVSSVFQGAFSCGTNTCSGATPQCDRVTAHTGGTCVAANAACAAQYVRATPASDIAAGNLCSSCATTGALNALSTPATKCVAKTIAGGDGCLAGYTDKSTGAAADTTTLAGNCQYCVTATHAFNAVSAAATACIAKTVVAGGLCATGYTDKSDGTAATAAGGTLAGDCKYCVAATYAANALSGGVTKCVAKTIGADGGCLTGYTDKADGSTANTVTLAGDCKYCLTATYALNALSTAATKCVAKTIAGGDGCLTGYTDKSTGAAADTTTLAGDCKYCVAATHVLNAKSAAATKCVAKTIAAGDGCLTGYTDKSDGTAANTVTLTGNCDYCVTGYTLNSSTGLCVQNTPASSSVIAYGVFLIAALFAALF